MIHKLLHSLYILDDLSRQCIHACTPVWYCWIQHWIVSDSPFVMGLHIGLEHVVHVILEFSHTQAEHYL